MDFRRAVEQGIDSARMFRKDGPSPYHNYHPLFNYWWNGAVLKSDCRDLSDREIVRRVMRQLKPRGKEN